MKTTPTLFKQLHDCKLMLKSCRLGLQDEKSDIKKSLFDDAKNHLQNYE